MSEPIPSVPLNPHSRIPLLTPEASSNTKPPDDLLITKSHTHPSYPPLQTNASIAFIGNATTLLTYHGARILTDPNFLHAGDHVHLGPGVTATRTKNPSVDITSLPPIDLILLSHYHEDHFDRLVEDSLTRSFPIISTPHAQSCLESKSPPFTAITPLSTFSSAICPIADTTTTSRPAIKITAMPAQHTPPGPANIVTKINDLLGAVPPVNGWLLELGHLAAPASQELETGYRIYISGDTLLVDQLQEIPKWLAGAKVDLMIVHLGGTTIPGPKLPLVMVTMDAKQGVGLMKLVKPEVTVPVHMEDYDVFVSGVEEFKKEVEKEGLGGGVVMLERGEEYRFWVGGPGG
ncbi:beta-lactamase-like protein [Podospora conica]|nr:beta-lactamase-like protein [Schizothecium conicum]